MRYTMRISLGEIPSLHIAHFNNRGLDAGPAYDKERKIYMSVIKNFLALVLSKAGIPCLWENGGGYTNTGRAQIITDNQGYPKRAICVRTHGDRACGDHALIPVRAGDHVVTVDRYHNQVAVRVERIDSINGNRAELVPETAPICVDAINAAIEKSNDYHCRDPYYIELR